MVPNGQFMIVYEGKIRPYYPPYGPFWTTARQGFSLLTALRGYHKV
jgi:hypothetical protein